MITLQITPKQKQLIAAGLLAHSENLAKRIGYTVLYPANETLTIEQLKAKHDEINKLIEILSQTKENTI
jgi:hypothetical protein